MTYISQRLHSYYYNLHGKDLQDKTDLLRQPKFCHFRHRKKEYSCFENILIKIKSLFLIYKFQNEIMLNENKLFDSIHFMIQQKKIYSSKKIIYRLYMKE